MIIKCERCNTGFSLDDSLIKKSGSKVRCSNCKHIFVAYAPEPAIESNGFADTEPAETAMPDAEAVPADQEAQVEEDAGIDEDIPPEAIVAVDMDASQAGLSPASGAAKIEDLELFDIDKMLVMDGVGESESEEIETGDQEQSLVAEPVLEGDEIESYEGIAFEETDSFEVAADEAPPEAAESSAEISSDGDLELDLEALLKEGEKTEESGWLEIKPAAAEPDEAVSAGEELEIDLEPMLEADEDKAEAETSADFEETSEINFAEIEQMAGIDFEDASETGKEQGSADQDFGLELDLSLESEDQSDLHATDTGAQDMLELPELEDIIEDTPPAPHETDSSQGLDWELDQDLQLEETPEEEGIDMVLEADGSKVDAYEDTIITQESESEEAVLEYGIEADQQQSLFETEETIQEQVEEHPDYSSEMLTADKFTDGKAGQEADTGLAPDEIIAPPAKKRRVGAPILILLVFILIGGAGYGTYTVLNMLNIKIPYLSDLKIPYLSDFFQKSPAKDAGDLRINTIDLNSKFIENSKVGRLFVITGKVKNGYAQARSFIQVTAKLYTKAEKPVQVETTSCGNIMSELELATLDMESLKMRLANRFGDQRSNLKVNPGQALPFMVIFSNFPDDLEEFTIEVAGSSPA